MSGLAVPATLVRLGIDELAPFSVPLSSRFRGVLRRDGLLLHGAAGWAEWSPFAEYPADVAARWLSAAVEGATLMPPTLHRSRVRVNVTVPAVPPTAAAALVVASGARTAKVKVAEPAGRLEDDLERLIAVRDVLGPQGRIRVDANAAWDVPTAVAALERMVEAVGGLEYVEQPCRRLDELAEVRRRTGIAVAADESLRLAPDAFAIDLAGACDLLVVKLQPAGGVRRALRLAEAHGLPVVVSSALETSVGLAAGVLLAAALPVLEHDCGLGTAALLDEDTVARPLVPVDGALEVSDALEVVEGRDAGDRLARDACGPRDPDVTAALEVRLLGALELLDARPEDGPREDGSAPRVRTEGTG